MSRLQLAVEQIVFARNYTIELLEETPSAEWFQFVGGVSHVAWQVGHLAFAEYRLALWRIRGERAKDQALFSAEFKRQFGPDAMPQPESEFTAEDIRTTLDRVHTQAVEELMLLNEAELDQPVLHPHPFATTKLLALLWCAQHEMVHAGQIGLLRRQLGHPPLW